MTLNEDSLEQSQIRRNFSRHAEEYERYALVQKTVANNLIERLPAAAGVGRVLEVGCGTGVLSRKLLRQVPRSGLFLSDIAHGMSCKVAQDYPDLAVADADAADLPFVASSFDLVCSSSVYQWVDHLPQAFAELHRVLRPGGQIAVALFGEQTLYELRRSHAAVLDKRESHSQGFPDCSQLSHALAGLFKVDLLDSELETEWHASVPELLRSLKAIGAQNASSKRPGGLRSRRTMQRMYSYYRDKYERGGRIPATYEVIYLVARKI